MTGDKMCTNQRISPRNYKTTNFVGSWFCSDISRFVTKREARGFTLIETLVALTLFSVVVTIGTDLFFTFQRLSQRTEALESMVSTSRFIVERVAREVREGTIYYPSFALPISGAQNTLYLLNSADEPLNFAYRQDTNDLTLTIPSGSESLSPAGVNIRAMAFYVFPSEDPFTFDLVLENFAADEQPRVTLFMSLDNNLPVNDRNYTRYDVQTTISSRAYRR